MSSPYTSTHVAAGFIKRGITRIADKYPYHAKVLEKFRIVASVPVGSIGVTLSREGILLQYNPEFVVSLPADELDGVLLHEVHHVVLGHLTIDPAEFSGPWALTVALELTANDSCANGCRREQSGCRNSPICRHWSLPNSATDACAGSRTASRSTRRQRPTTATAMASPRSSTTTTFGRRVGRSTGGAGGGR